MDDKYHFGCQFTADLIAMNTAGESVHAVHDVCTCRYAQVHVPSQGSAITEKPVRITCTACCAQLLRLLTLCVMIAFNQHGWQIVMLGALHIAAQHRRRLLCF